MEDLIIKTGWNDLTVQGFDGGGLLYIDLENDDTTKYAWLTADQAKQLARHLIGALEEIGETI